LKISGPQVKFTFFTKCCISLWLQRDEGTVATDIMGKSVSWLETLERLFKDQNEMFFECMQSFSLAWLNLSYCSKTWFYLPGV